jgi:PilZ domain
MSDAAPPDKNRRRCRRRAPRSRVRVTCRRGGLDLGPNLALSVQDLSEAGVRLVVKEPLEPGREVSIGLEGQSHSRPILRGGVVIWCLDRPDGAYWIGVRFEKELPYTLVLELSREPPAYRHSGQPPACNPPSPR